MYSVRVYSTDDLEQAIVEGNNREAAIDVAKAMAPGVNLILEEDHPDGRVTASAIGPLVGMGF